MYPYDILEKIFGKTVTIFGQPIHLYLYGLFIAIGIILCLVLLLKYFKKKGVPQKVTDFAFFVGIFAIIFGFLFAKLFQAYYNWLEDPSKAFNFANAGITVMGGVLGGTLSFIAIYFGIGHFIFRDKDKGLHKKHFNDIFRIAPCSITLAHAFGRIGCLMAGCCHGKYLGQEYVFGGIWMKGISNGWGYYVPVQLYESLILFALFGALLFLCVKKECNITFPLYTIVYGVWRFIIEFFRDDSRGGFILGLSPSQRMSIYFILFGVVILIIYYCKKIPFFFKKVETAKEGAIEEKETNDKELVNEEEKKKVEVLKCPHCGVEIDNPLRVICPNCKKKIHEKKEDE